MTNTKKIVECGILIALAFVLSYIRVFEMPSGGSITAASMLPIIIISYRNGAGYGLLSGVIYSVLQMIQGFYPPPVATLTNYFLLVSLDYVVAFGILGIACVFAKPFSNKLVGFSVSTVIVCALRALCHIISGVIIWGDASASFGAALTYSATYNLSYMIPETIITALLATYIGTRLVKNTKA